MFSAKRPGRPRGEDFQGGEQDRSGRPEIAQSVNEFNEQQGARD
jgi:hypothetical protein